MKPGTSHEEITMTKFCPDACPACGCDLASDGYPIAHQDADTGQVCDFRWDTSAAA